MRCKEEGCRGKIDMSKPVSLMTGCAAGPCGSASIQSNAYPCDACGRLHWGNGSLVFNRAKQKAFLRNDEVVLED